MWLWAKSKNNDAAKQKRLKDSILKKDNAKSKRCSKKFELQCSSKTIRKLGLNDTKKQRSTSTYTKDHISQVGIQLQMHA